MAKTKSGQSLGEMFVTLGFNVDVAEFEKLAKKINTMKDNLGELADAANRVGNVLKTLAVGAAAAGTAIFAVVKTTADYGDKLVKTSQKIGYSVESLQELAHAAELSGVGFESLESGLAKFSKGLVEAATTGKGEFAEGLQSLNIDLKSAAIQTKDTDAVLNMLANRFAGMPDGAQKAATAMQFFGKSGVQMIPLLNSGAENLGKLRQEARELGIVMSTDAAKASEEFNDNLSRLMVTLKGIKNSVGVALMPAVNQIVTKIRDWVAVNKELIASKLQEFAQNLVPMIERLFKAALDLAKAVMSLAEALNSPQGLVAALLGLKSTQMAVSLGMQAMSAATKTGAAAFGMLSLAAGGFGLAMAGVSAILQATQTKIDKIRASSNSLLDDIRRNAAGTAAAAEYGELTSRKQLLEQRISRVEQASGGDVSELQRELNNRMFNPGAYPVEENNARVAELKRRISAAAVNPEIADGWKAELEIVNAELAEREKKGLAGTSEYWDRTQRRKETTDAINNDPLFRSGVKRKLSQEAKRLGLSDDALRAAQDKARAALQGGAKRDVAFQAGRKALRENAGVSDKDDSLDAKVASDIKAEARRLAEKDVADYLKAGKGRKAAVSAGEVTYKRELARLKANPSLLGFDEKSRDLLSVLTGGRESSDKFGSSGVPAFGAQVVNINVHNNQQFEIPITVNGANMSNEKVAEVVGPVVEKEIRKSYAKALRDVVPAVER